MDLCGLESPAQALAFQQLGGAPQQFQPGVFRRGLLSTKSWISHGSHQLWTAYPPGLFERRQPQFLDLLQALLGRTTQLCCHGFSSSVSWPINEKVNQSIKLVINRSITKKISESQGISWNLCLLWLLWLELGGFFMGVRMRIPHDPPTFSGQKKAPTRLCFWPSVDVETGNPLRGMGHESPGCPTSGWRPCELKYVHDIILGCQTHEFMQSGK